MSGARENMPGLRSDQVKQPGAYEWHADGRRHVGFIRADKRGKLQGCFVCDDSALIAVSLDYGDGAVCEGLFYGPLCSQQQDAAPGSNTPVA